MTRSGRRAHPPSIAHRCEPTVPQEEVSRYLLRHALATANSYSERIAAHVRPLSAFLTKHHHRIHAGGAAGGDQYR